MPTTNANAAEELKKLEKVMSKLRNQLRRADLDYLCQISLNSAQPGVIKYATQMTPPATGLAPVTFMGDSCDEVVAQVKVFLKHTDYDAVEKAYHEAQIIACENTIKGHQDRIAELAKPKEERDGGSEASVEGEVTQGEQNEPTEDTSEVQSK